MAGEAAFWQYLQRGMKNRWHVQRHEDRLSLGVPDLSYACRGRDGWIELKALTAFPARPDTPVWVDRDVAKFKRQVMWLTERAGAGDARCFVFVRVGQEHFLFPWTRCPILIKGPTQDEFREASSAQWGRRIFWDEFEEEISQ